MAFVGLELATSVIKLNELRDYWSTAMFSGHPDFGKVMGRDEYLYIRSSLKLHHYKTYFDFKFWDPLWHSRPLLKHLNYNCVDITTPKCLSVLD